MKSSVFTCVVAAFLGLSSPIYAEYDDSEFVTCGSAIKLHSKKGTKKYFLSSDGQRINGNGAAGQQLVTGSPEGNTGESLWMVKEAHGETPCPTGTKIEYDQKFRLTHLKTGANLHSHDLPSPLSRQQDVCAFGEHGTGDFGDDWIVAPKGNKNDKYWRIGSEVILMHFETSMYLGSTDQAMFTAQNCGRGCPVMEHLEVFGRVKGDSFAIWKTETGIYISK